MQAQIQWHALWLTYELRDGSFSSFDERYKNTQETSFHVHDAAVVTMVDITFTNQWILACAVFNNKNETESTKTDIFFFFKYAQK